MIIFKVVNKAPRALESVLEVGPTSLHAFLIMFDSLSSIRDNFKISSVPIRQDEKTVHEE